MMDSKASPSDLRPDELRRLLETGQGLLAEGRLGEAEATLREALDRTRGLGTVLESRACGTLATFYGIVGRDFEAMLLYRHALAIDRTRGDWSIVVIHQANLAATYTRLGLDDALGAALDGADEALEHLDGDARARAATHLLWHRFEACVEDHDLRGARAYLDEIRERFAEHDEVRIQVAILELEADVLLREGCCDAAVERLDEGLVTSGVSLTSRLSLLLRRIECLEAHERWGGAKEVGVAALDLLEHAATEEVLAEQCIAVGAALAACFEHDEGAPELARRAYDLAAGAVLERIRQLEACARDLPELAWATREDATWLSGLRHSFHAQQETLLGRVAVLLEAARRAGISPLHRDDPDDDLVRICAWCQAVLSRRGQWVPVAHYVPSRSDIRITHTICERCAKGIASA